MWLTITTQLELVGLAALADVVQPLFQAVVVIVSSAIDDDRCGSTRPYARQAMPCWALRTRARVFTCASATPISAGVDQPALEIPFVAEIGRGLLRIADAPGCPGIRVPRHHQRRDAAYMRRRHAGAIFGVVSLVEHAGIDALAWRQHVGLDAPVSSRSAAREIAYAIGVRLEAMRRADGDDGFGVAGIGDADGAVRIDLAGAGQHALEAAITGRGDDHHTAGDETLALLADRRAATGVILDVVQQREAEIDA